jgi:uncharacterized protein with ParB-like and HNH nuclease domain
MNKIDARSKSVRELMDGVKYGIDYYQREYKWTTKQIVKYPKYYALKYG